MHSVTKTERERERMRERCGLYDGVQRKKAKEDNEEKLRMRGTEQKREVSLSRTDIVCAARSGQTGPINIVETRQINLKLSHVARQKRSGVSDGPMAAARVTPIYCRIKARHH